MFRDGPFDVQRKSLRWLHAAVLVAACAAIAAGGIRNFVLAHRRARFRSHLPDLPRCSHAGIARDSGQRPEHA